MTRDETLTAEEVEGKNKLKQEAEESLDKMVTDKGIILGCHEGFCYDEVTDFMAEFAEPREKRIAELEKENADLKCECRRCVYTDSPCILSDYGKDRNGICDHFKDVFDEVVELKSKIGMSIECDKAQKNGELCLGYGGDEDEPCEICKNCIKCESGYYQLGETEKDDQLTKAREIIRNFCDDLKQGMTSRKQDGLIAYAEQFISDIKEG